MKISKITIFVVMVFTNVSMYSAESDKDFGIDFRSKYMEYKSKAESLKSGIFLAWQEIDVLKAENAELNQQRVAMYHERTFAMIRCIQIQSELEGEKAKRIAMEHEIARLKSLLPK